MPVSEEAPAVPAPWVGAVHRGPSTVTVETPIDTVPVFARAGAVIPVERDARIELQAYPPDPDHHTDTTTQPGGSLISDDGDDGNADPIEEHFHVRMVADGKPYVSYTGPAESLPYHVDWQPWRQK